MTVSALLVDYGEVISCPQDPSAVKAMSILAGLDLPTFTERYWRHRAQYDRGMDAAAYWVRVSERAVPEAELAELARIDVESWSELRAGTLEVLRDAAQGGTRMALLSNAPHGLAAYLAEHPALGFFSRRLFSSQLGRVKPEPEIYAAAVQAIGSPAAEVLLIDDRAENVEGAIRAGLQGVRFVDPGALRAELRARGLEV